MNDNKTPEKIDVQQKETLFPVQAIVMDMDGTLLNEHNEISPKTEQVLKDLEKRGVRLVLASGRSYTRLMKYARQLEMDQHEGHLIEIDGVASYSLKDGKRKKYHMMQPDEIREVFDWLMHQDAESQAMFDDGLFCFFPENLRKVKEKIREEEHRDEDYPWTAGPWSWLTDFRDGYPDIRYISDVSQISCPVNKIQIMQEEDKLADLYKKLVERFGDQFSIYRTTPRQLEILPLGYSKGKGVEMLMEENGWDRDKVLVFGDGENDVSMFDVVDHSFAMGNAREYVQKKAAHLAGSNREDGIVAGLKSLNVINTGKLV